MQFILTDKTVKKILILGAVLMLCLAALSAFSQKKDTQGIDDTERLARLLEEIDGVDSVSVAFSYDDFSSKSPDRVNGIAVVYQGTQDAVTRRKIYELIGSLYGISYSRIYVSG